MKFQLGAVVDLGTFSKDWALLRQSLAPAHPGLVRHEAPQRLNTMTHSSSG